MLQKPEPTTILERPRFKLIKSETVPLTPEKAQEFRGMEPSPTERDLNQTRMKFLREKIRAGLFLPPHWAIAILRGRKMRVNGQTSSNALCEEADSFPQGLHVHIDTFEVDDEHALGLLFQQFDARQSSRTALDIAGAYKGLQPALRALPRAIGKLGVTGIWWSKKNVEQIPVGVKDRAFELFSDEQLHPFILWLGDIFDIKTPELQHEAVVAAMYQTFLHNEEAAKEFWPEIARGGDPYDDEAPTTVLDAGLKELKDDKTGDFRKEVGGAANIYSGCIYAWNAYRAGKKITTIKWDTKGKGFPKVSE